MPRILVVDDEEAILDAICAFLKSEGFEVMGASNGKIALKLHEKNPADLIITDIFMPEMDGIETIQAFKQVVPHVKIIAMSGGYKGESDQYMEIAESFGAVKTFTKPFEMKELLEVINNILN